MTEQKIEPGIYRHWKGKLYFVSGVGRHSEKEGEEFVVYYPLYQSESKIWIRPAEMFLDEVQKDGYSGQRFVFVMEWHFANILPGLQFRDVETFYSATVFTIKQVAERSGALIVEAERTDGKSSFLSIDYFRAPSSHCEFV